MPLEDQVSRETLDRLRRYHALLLKWQEKINLVSPYTIPQAWERHFEDSAQVAPLLPAGINALYDLGSGAGFPGLVLAIMRPDISVTLIESDAKKCAFLQTVSRETNTAVAIQNIRIESASQALPAPDLVTARALSSLSELLDYAAPWLAQKPDIVFIFPKGAGAQGEIEAAKSAGWTFDLTEIKSETEAGARILCLKTVRKTSV